MLGPIELTEDEAELLKQIHFPPQALGAAGDEARRASREPAYELTASLVARGAIPPVRWRYWVDPTLNIGQHRSRKATFEKNGTRGDDIYRHPPSSSTSATSSLVLTCRHERRSDSRRSTTSARPSRRGTKKPSANWRSVRRAQSGSTASGQPGSSSSCRSSWGSTMTWPQACATPS